MGTGSHVAGGVRDPPRRRRGGCTMTTDIRDILTIVSLALALGSLIYNWLTRPGTDALKKVEAVEDRVARVEGELRHLPDKGAVHRMELSLAELRGDLRTMSAQLAPVKAVADRLQEFLLREAEK